MSTVMPDPAARLQSVFDQAGLVEPSIHSHLERLLASPSLYGDPAALRHAARLLTAAATLAELIAQLDPTVGDGRAGAERPPPEDAQHDQGDPRHALAQVVVELAAWRERTRRSAS
jgi:hypothetical protein